MKHEFAGHPYHCTYQILEYPPLAEWEYLKYLGPRDYDGNRVARWNEKQYWLVLQVWRSLEKLVLSLISTTCVVICVNCLMEEILIDFSGCACIVEILRKCCEYMEIYL